MKARKLLTAVFIGSLVFFATCIPSYEYYALMDIYKELGGSSWKNNSGWNTGQSPCFWYGIQCDEQRDSVIQILLGNNNLKGSLPASLGNFSKLIAIDFNRNKINGPIPPEIGKLTNLYAVGAMYNQLTSIPEEIGYCSQLRFLHLDFNIISSPVPVGLTKLQKLEYLGLYSNRLSGAIPKFSDFLGLQYFILGKNKLSGKFPILENMPALQNIALGDNQLVGQIPDLSVYPSLVDIELYKNNFEGILSDAFTSEISRDFVIISIHSNSFKGDIPNNIRLMENLLIFDAHDNEFSGEIPPFIEKLAGTKTDLSGNPFSCPIPSWANFTGATCKQSYQNAPETKTFDLRREEPFKETDQVDLLLCGFSKCPDMKKMEDLVASAQPEIGSIVNYEISFIGEADDDLPTGFYTMHGQTESIGNLFEICAYNLYTSDIWDPFICCLNKNQADIPVNAINCAQTITGVDYSELKKCALGSEGNALLEKSINYCSKMEAVWSPTVYLDGERVCLWDSVPCDFKDLNGFIEEVCQRYHGITPPLACQK